MQDEIDAIPNYPHLQKILTSLLEKSQAMQGKPKYGEATIRAMHIEGAINDFAGKTASNPVDVGDECLLDDYLGRMLATIIGIGRDVSKARDLMEGVSIALDRLIEPCLEADLPRCLDYSLANNDRFQLYQQAKELPCRRSYMVDAIELADKLEYDELKSSLESLEKRLPESFGTEDDRWSGSEACALWTQDLRKVIIEHRQIGHDWQNLAEGMTLEARQALKDYYNANTILAECLTLTDAPDATQQEKAKRRENLLLPIAEIERRKGLRAYYE